MCCKGIGLRSRYDVDNLWSLYMQSGGIVSSMDKGSRSDGSLSTRRATHSPSRVANAPSQAQAGKMLFLYW